MEELSVYLKKPARKWEEGLPLGNGRLGAMVMGRVKEETILINEETLCYGPPRGRENPDGFQELQNIRNLLVEGKVEDASFLARMALTSTPKYNNPYQPIGELRLYFQGGRGKPENYERRLDIEQAVARVSFELDETRYVREYFVSKAYQVLAIRLKAEGEGEITMSANIGRKPFEEFTGALGEGTVGCWGENGPGGMHYLSAVRIGSGDGGVLGDFAYVKNQKEVVIYLAAQTDYEACLKGCQAKGQRAYDSLYEVVKERLDRAKEAGFEAIYKEHLRDYRELYDTFDLKLGEENIKVYTTDELLQRYREGIRTEELYLTRMLLQYARYLMISSSGHCLLPANLQGIWNGSYEPPWQCQYTININTQMNYWFVEKSGLSSCHLPLFNLLKLLEKNGKVTAKKLYHSRGFCAHHNTNVWGCTSPEGIFDASPYWVMGGAWFCIHLYEHYEYTGDLNFLREEAMPLMRESIRFFEDYLCELPDGSLVTGPVVSPENTYRAHTGEAGALCMGTAMDNSILRQLIQSYLEGMDILGLEQIEDRELLENLLKRIPPLKIGKSGRLLEWMEEYEEMEPGHRHISHLYGLHPGYEISPETEAYFEAAKNTLSHRLKHGGGHTGWSRAWLACFASRLQDGESLAKHIEKLILNCIQDNLLDLHPPFQIDGNFGIAEAILEALVQERGGKIYLLPALPERWSDGVLRGYCLKGNAKLTMEWKQGEIASLELVTPESRELTICCLGQERKISCRGGQVTRVSI